jgi:hypothetical protein
VVIIPAQVDIYGFIDAGVVTWAKPWSAMMTPEHGIIVSEGLLLEYRKLRTIVDGIK